MQTVLLESVTKLFHPSPFFLHWIGRDAGTSSLALDEVSLIASRGDILVLLGPNGSGKTTLLKLISTMLLPDRGRITVHGADTRLHSDQVRRHVGIVVASERSFFPRLTALENLEVFAALDDLPRNRRPSAIDSVLEQTDLTTHADDLVMTFSSGMYQKLGLARALLKHPSVLLLDEPTRSIDAGTSLHIWKLLRGFATDGTTVILATHRFDEATALGNSVAFMRNGKLSAKHPLPTGMSPEDLRIAYFREVDGMANNVLICGGTR